MPHFAHGYALLIAVDANAAGWALPDAGRDIDSLHRVLVHPDRCAYPAEHVRVVRGAGATAGGIRDGLGWLRRLLVTGDSRLNIPVFGAWLRAEITQ